MDNSLQTPSFYPKSSDWPPPQSPSARSDAAQKNPLGTGMPGIGFLRTGSIITKDSDCRADLGPGYPSKLFVIIITGFWENATFLCLEKDAEPMRRVCSLRRLWVLGVLGLTWWLAMEGWSLAQTPAPGEGGGRNLYLASYFIVLLGIFLGLVVVCNPSRRRDRPKPESYGD